MLQKLFSGRSLLLEIETGRLFPSSKQHVKSVLAKVRKTTEYLQEEKNTFPTAYAAKALMLGECAVCSEICSQLILSDAQSLGCCWLWFL